MSDRLAEHRDERIAAALAELAVPEHEPGFFEQHPVQSRDGSLGIEARDDA